MKRIIPVLLMLIIVIAVTYIFFQKNYNIEKNGNTKGKIKNLETYILQIKSYEAVAEITVNSNKSVNLYKVKQKENAGKSFKQEVLEPETIARKRVPL